jgi:tetratricopeptide (TPR) repeat protein
MPLEREPSVKPMSAEKPQLTLRLLLARCWRARWLVLIFLGALALRLALWMQPLHQLANDEIEYVQVAGDLLNGEGWVFYDSYHWLRAPLYPLFLAASYALSGHNLWLAALPTIVLSSFTVVLNAGIARLCVGPERRGVPLLAALLTALLWTLATFASLYMAETLATALFSAAILFLLLWQRLHHNWMLAVAAVCYGLTIITRSASMAFLPFLLFWIALQLRTPHLQLQSQRDWLHRLGIWLRSLWTSAFFKAALLFVCCCGAVIAPWTLRNCVAYGRCILVETGLSYNMWAFNEPREDGETIFRELEAIKNPAERADYATAKGRARLVEDPLILLRKLNPNWHYLWAVNPIIEDRFILRTYYADPPPLVFLAALIFDDLLMLLIVVFGIAGLARIKNRSAMLLFGMWLLYIVGTTLLTHTEGRYRHFLFPVLIPLAAVAMLDCFHALRKRDWLAFLRLPKTHLALVLVSLLIGHAIVVRYPWEWAIAGAQRSAWQLLGDLAIANNQPERAIQAYQHALEGEERPDAWVRLGDAHRLVGQHDSAITAYRAASALTPAYIVPALHLGDLLRERGDVERARRTYDVPYAKPQQVLDWAWGELPVASLSRIEVGDGLDFGYVDGMYVAEYQGDRYVRWTNGAARIRIAGSPDGVLIMRLAAPRPDGKAVSLQVCVERKCQFVPLESDWRSYRIQLPASEAAEQIIELNSSTFLGPDGRTLGVIIDEIWR